MNLYVIDTDTFSVYSRGHPGLNAQIDAHPVYELAITVITVEEVVSG